MQTLALASPAGLALAIDELRVAEGGAEHYVYPDHIRLIDREVVEAVARAHERQRAAAAGEVEHDRPEILLIEVPPRHGKSTEISEHAPAWFIGTFPDRHVILCSYQAEFAASWGLKARMILEEYGRQLYGVELDPSSKAAKRWQLKGRRGGMITAGVGGPITGMGADLLIIDDPIKNAEEAMSEVIREKHWDWWLSTARTRLQPGAVVILLLTRWHQDDLAGRLLQAAADGGDPVREIRLPALAEEDDPLGREPGEALWPERYSRSYLEHTREIDSYWFAAMFQGKPTPDEGGIFNRKNFRYFEVDGDEVVLRLDGGETKRWGIDWCEKVTYVDLAVSEKETADYTVATEVWVTPDQEMLIRNVVRDRIPGPDQAGFLEAHYVGRLKVEAMGYQAALVQELVRRGLPVEAVHPDKDKVTRAAAAGALYRSGKVFHLAGAEWLADFEVELLAFPMGEHDDQVDTVSYAAKDLPTLSTTTVAQRSRGRTLTKGLRTREM